MSLATARHGLRDGIGCGAFTCDCAAARRAICLGSEMKAAVQAGLNAYIVQARSAIALNKNTVNVSVVHGIEH